MSAFVRAHPYDICDGMPEILVALSNHLHDPQPLQVTIFKDNVVILCLN